MNQLPPKSRTKYLLCLAIGVLTLALYLPSTRHDFLEYDDQQYVTENPHVRNGLSLQGITWAFGYHVSNWHPVTWLSHMLDCQIYGLNPAGHHFTNALIHAATAALLCLVLTQMSGALWPSGIVAVLFAWHPAHVESVAWVSERKDLLSGFFFVLTLWAYASYAQSRNADRPDPIASKSVSPVSSIGSPLLYTLSLASYIFGLLSKPMLVTVPFVLLLLDFWPLNRVQWNTRRLIQLLLEKIPFLALSVIVSILTIAAQKQSFSVVSTAGLPIASRAAHALVASVQYLATLVVPAKLAIFYPYQSSPGWEVCLAGALLAAITILALRFGARWPFFPVGWFWFLGMLVPVIGLVQVGDQAWADRYTYLPSIGLFVVLAWGFGVLRQRHPLPSPAMALIGVLLGTFLLIGTSRQLRYWKDTRTLFQHAADVIPNNYMAITLLGSLLAKEGKLDQAIEQYQRALQIKPSYAEAHFFLGNALDQQGHLDQAIAEYNRSLGFKPMLEQTHILLGSALARQHKDAEARAQYLAALELNPDSSVAHNNLARLLQQQGELDQAILHYQSALKLDPGLAQAHNNLGVLFMQKGKANEGVRQLREALKLQPDNAESQYNLAVALNQQGQWAEAVSLFSRTVNDSTPDPKAHQEFAKALAHTKKTREAMAEYARALLLQPSSAEALDGLSWILATSTTPEFRNGPEAVRMAELACDLTARKDPAKLKTLAAAYAEAGRFPDAVTTVQQAMEAATKMPRRIEASELQRMLESFQGAKPWRE